MKRDKYLQKGSLQTKYLVRTMSFFLIQYSSGSGNTISCFKKMKRHIQQYIVMSPISKLFYKLKTYEKYEVFLIDRISPEQVI